MSQHLLSRRWVVVPYLAGTDGRLLGIIDLDTFFTRRGAERWANRLRKRGAHVCVEPLV